MYWRYSLARIQGRNRFDNHGGLTLVAANRNTTRDQREQQLLRISELNLQRYTASEIARELGLSRQTVQRDLSIIRLRRREAQIQNNTERILNEEAEINQTARESWQSWRRSKEDAEIKIQKVRKTEVGSQGSPVELSVRTEGQAGDVSYLRVVLECSRERRKLWGVDAPEKLSVGYENLTPEELSAKKFQIREQIEQLRAALGRGGDVFPGDRSGGVTPPTDDPTPGPTPAP